MKFITKCALAAVLAVGSLTALNAQKLTGGVNLMTGMPMGDFGDAAGFGIGGGVDFNYYVADQIAVGLEVGYISFPGESIDVLGVSVDLPGYTMIPIIAKGTYYFNDEDEGFRPYAGLGVGFYMLSQTIEIPGVGDESIDQNGLGISPRIGAEYAFNDQWALNLNVQYNILLNEKEEDTETTVTDPFTGNTSTVTTTTTYPSTPYLGINLGIVYTFMD